MIYALSTMRSPAVRPLFIRLWLLLTLAFVVSCGSTPPVASWRDSLAEASPKRTLERARNGIGRQTPYQLGAGGFDPAKPPQRCDCSGFVAWTIGVPRELPPASGRWLQSDTFWTGGPPVGRDLFSIIPLESAKPGDLLVYPDGPWGEGHVGVVSQVDDGRITRVIHCSSSNWKKYGDAILETPPTPWRTAYKNPRLVRVNYKQLRKQFNVASAERWWWFW